MKTSAAILLVMFTSIAVGSGGYLAAKANVSIPSVVQEAKATAARVLGIDKRFEQVPNNSDRDRRTLYSVMPEETSDGRAVITGNTSDDESLYPKEDEKEANASTERRVLYYRNPMGLPDTSPVPKKDSMGMDYLPVYDGEVEDGAMVKVSTAKLQRTGVKTALATKSAIVRPVNAPATILFDERRISVVSLRTEAFLEEVEDITTGSAISQGQPLVRFYAKEIAGAGALYAADLKSGDKSTAHGSRQRLENLGVPETAIEEIETTGKAPISVTLRAPRSGVVLERMAIEGMMSRAGETLFRIADTSLLWVEANVSEFDLGLVKVGAEATVRVRSLPGKVFIGNVDLIYPEVEDQTRTARVRIQLPNPDGALMARMYADVAIKVDGSEPAITVPDSAVIDTGDRQVVIVDRGNGEFEPRDVKLGSRGSGMVEVKQGVIEGDRVVVSANFLIDAESNLKAALSALVSEEAKP